MASPHAPHAPPDDAPSSVEKRFVFPRWVNYLLPLLVLGTLGAGLYVPTVIYAGFSPKATAVGYAPSQPVPFSHAVHAGQLGMDCRYCHSTVEKAGFAAVPPTQTCMQCHVNIKGNSPNLAPVKQSWEQGTPVPWVKIHDLPDYAYFNHAAHINKGVGCVSCHGRIDQMEVVQQTQPLSMNWCLECHREPEKHLRPKDQVTNMAWTPADEKDRFGTTDQIELGLKLKKEYGIRDVAYMTSCYVCHR
jgi:hypothetical protein